MIKPILLTGIFIAASSPLIIADEIYSFDAIGVAYEEDFNSYRGTLETLPPFFSVTWDEDRTAEPFTGVGDFNTSDTEFEYGGFSAYTADGENYSFGIREREPVNLRNARIFFSFTNNTGVAIEGFWVSYDVESWYRGDRLNRIRLKYDVLLTSEERETFETDIFSTDNPGESIDADSKQNGSLPENRIRVSDYVNLSELEIVSGDEELGTFGPLQPGETAYFRWQFSNLAIGESGSLRSGLAINNLEIIADGEVIDHCPEAGWEQNPALGEIYHYGSCWAWAGDSETQESWGIMNLSLFSEDNSGWFHHSEQGWLYLVSGGSFAEHAFLFSDDLGWLVASDAFTGSFYRFEDQSFHPWISAE